MGRRKRRTLTVRSNDAKLNAGMPGFDSYDIVDWEEKFYYSLRARNRSKDTIKYYRQQIRSLKLAFEEQNIATRVDRITKENIEINFIAFSLNVRGVKYSTVAIRLRGLRAFFNYIV